VNQAAARFAHGYMYALDAATGVELWKFSSGGSCLSVACRVEWTRSPHRAACDRPAMVFVNAVFT